MITLLTLVGMAVTVYGLFMEDEGAEPEDTEDWLL